jgi:hypothetical protein
MGNEKECYKPKCQLCWVKSSGVRHGSSKDSCKDSARNESDILVSEKLQTCHQQFLNVPNQKECLPKTEISPESRCLLFAYKRPDPPAAAAAAMAMTGMRMYLLGHVETFLCPAGNNKF